MFIHTAPAGYLWRCVGRVLALLFAFFAAQPALAAGCTVTTGVTIALGTFSPAAVYQGAVPVQKGRAGLTCPSALLTLLGNNYLKAKFTSTNNMKLLQDGGTNTIAYVPSADQAQTVKFTQGGTIDYMQNNLLNLLGLLGGSSADIPMYIRPSGGATPPVGTYRDRITINWSWYQCTSLGLGNSCLTTPDTGTGTTTIDMTLVVTPFDVTMTTTSKTTWDPIRGTTNPIDVPSSRSRTSVLVTNPDIVALDASTLALIVPMDTRQAIALEGDGTPLASTIVFTDGSPASGLLFTYTSPSSTTDDVDFSSDNGTTWTYVPTAGDSVTQGKVTNVRIRPRGAMAAGSNFTVSIPVSVR